MCPQTLIAGVKKSLVLESGTSKISVRTSKYFHPMSDGQVKNYSIRLYFLECPALFCNRTSTNLGVLVRRTSEHSMIFLPLNSYLIQQITNTKFEYFLFQINSYSVILGIDWRCRC